MWVGEIYVQNWKGVVVGVVFVVIVIVESAKVSENWVTGLVMCKQVYVCVYTYLVA